MPGPFGIADLAVVVGVDLVALLQSRDLGGVDHGQVVDPVRVQLQAVVVVDGEVAQRMGRSHPGPGDQQARPDQQGRRDPVPGPHAVPPAWIRARRAAGACSTEKCGLIFRARLSWVRACALCPRANSIIPRW